jgi:hypothetical protein
MPRLPRPKGNSGKRRPRNISTRECLDAPGRVGFTRWSDACRQASVRGGVRATVAFHPECGSYHATDPGPLAAETRRDERTVA